MKRPLALFTGGCLLAQVAQASTQSAGWQPGSAWPAVAVSSPAAPADTDPEAKGSAALPRIPDMEKMRLATGCFWVYYNNSWYWICF